MKIKQIPEDFFVEEIIKIPELKDSGEQTYFWLTKKNWTTENAIRAISQRMHTSNRRFKFAGSKDKIAVTKQAVSVFKIPKERLENLRIKDISIEIIGFGDNPISLGTLEGNRFEIIIRDLSVKEISKLKKNFQLIKKSGFRNYFGEQRFGMGNTHIIGKYILQGKLEDAVKEIICTGGEREHEKKRAAREFATQHWKDWPSILERFPRHLHLENDLLVWLNKNPTDFAGALRVLPKHIRKLYVHAYQSWLWNFALKSLKTAKGNLPIPGFATKLSKDSFSQTIKRLLEKDNLTLESFRCARMPEIAVEGESRMAVIKPKKLKMNKPEADELNNDKQKIKNIF